MTNKVLQEVVELYPDLILPPYDEMLKIIGLDALVQFIKEFGGSSIYVPSERTIFGRCLAAQIKKEFNGFNRRELSKRFGFCEKTIERILSE